MLRWRLSKDEFANFFVCFVRSIFSICFLLEKLSLESSILFLSSFSSFSFGAKTEFVNLVFQQIQNKPKFA